MENKIIGLRDKISFNEDLNIKKENRVLVLDGATGEPIFKPLTNRVVLAGSAFMAPRLFKDAKIGALTPTYNNDLGLENSVNEIYTGDTNYRPGEFIFLWCVGKGGSGAQSFQKDIIKYASRITPEDIVPFKYVTSSNDLIPSQRQSYFGRKVMSNGRIPYYFKEIVYNGFKQQYLDGTPIDENVYKSERANNEEIESFHELLLKITTDDCRDWFRYTTSIEDAKLNQISLCTAWKKEVNGYTYYQDIRPYTILNFPTELLIDEDKSFDILYQVFH